MKELLDDIDRWRTAGKRVAVARVVDVEGSGPRGPGAAMAVNDDGEVALAVLEGNANNLKRDYPNVFVKVTDEPPVLPAKYQKIR